MLAVDACDEDKDEFDVAIDFEDEDGAITAVLSQPEVASDDEDNAPTSDLKTLSIKEGLEITAVSTPADSPSSSAATRVALTPEKVSPTPGAAEVVVPNAVL